MPLTYKIVSKSQCPKLGMHITIIRLRNFFWKILVITLFLLLWYRFISHFNKKEKKKKKFHMHALLYIAQRNSNKQPLMKKKKKGEKSRDVHYPSFHMCIIFNFSLYLSPPFILHYIIFHNLHPPIKNCHVQKGPFQ